VGDLEGRSRRLSRRTARLEEEAELDRLAEQRAEERLLRTAISKLSTEELQAMQEHLDGKDDEGWAEEDRPLMLRLLEIKEEARRAHEAGEFPWRAETRKLGGEAGP
jgi:hypothetical protein